MAIRRDKIIVVDIEATCWDVDPPPDGQLNEIIEIGLCICDVEANRIEGKRSILVKPLASEISPFCTQLTSITPQLVAEQGIEFSEACRILVADYDARKYLWASWGGYDRKLFRRQCRRLRISYPFGDKHLNLRTAFADFNGGERVGMVRALRMVNLVHEGVPHRGADDAWNVARLLQYLITQQGKDFVRRYR